MAVTQQAISKRLKWFRSEEIGFRTSWRREMLNGVSLLVNSCSKDRIRRSFYIALWPATKNKSTMIIPGAKNHGEYPDMPPRWRPDRIFTVPRFALHLVGPARCGVLWAVETEWNYRRGSVSNSIDAFEPIIEGETVTVPRETRQGYSPTWQCSATCRKTGQDILENAVMEGPTLPAVLSRRCSFRVPFVSIEGTWPGSSAFPLLRRSKKMDRFVDGLKRCIVFPKWYPTIAGKMEKSSGWR